MSNIKDQHQNRDLIAKEQIYLIHDSFIKKDFWEPQKPIIKSQIYYSKSGSQRQ